MFATNDFARNLVGAAGAALLAGACLFAATTPAQANEAGVSRTVSYADLNLAQPEGRATLDARIKSAARAVCATNSDDYKTRAEKSRCIRTAIAAATRS